ncbi:winged helix-turn-helix transcriptional regulator [Blastomonas sp.]|uniref:winged helix-turn-helix transcriptional regulator n=1 Tax=Blastomonas sp. TaxID=1909299 RepID=UPI00391C2DB1
MAKRLYDDACGTAHALELIGERWGLLVMRELMLGARRFNELRADLPGISANVLTQRLEGLEARLLVVRRRLPPPASVQVYELTQWGYEAEPLIQMLGRWAARSPWHDPTLPISGVSVMLSFRTMLDPARIGDLDIRAGFVFGDMTYAAHLSAQGFDVARGPVEGCDIVFTGSPHALAGAVYGGVPLEALADQDLLVAEGDPALLARFCGLFPLPPKVQLPPE